MLNDGHSVGYDYLIVATGSRHSYFGKDEWEKHAPGLKSIEDALEVRRRFLLAFEKAEQASTKEEQERWLTFVLIGGGPTGVEMAGMIPTVARHGLPSEFKNVDTTKARVILLEGGPRILPAFPEDLSLEQARGWWMESPPGRNVVAVAGSTIDRKSVV